MYLVLDSGDYYVEALCEEKHGEVFDFHIIKIQAEIILLTTRRKKYSSKSGQRFAYLKK